MTPVVDVIVVLWNHARFVEFMMDGLARVEYPREALTVHIVDNASTDGGIEKVKTYLAAHADVLPKTLIYEPGRNLGFAGGNNLIMRDSHADYVYLCNPDASFERDTLKEAVATAESNPRAGSIQSLQVLAEDPSRICSAGNRIHFVGFGYCDGYRDAVDQAPKEITPIAYASGASVLYRMSALEVGCFDEELFAYHEDLDLGWRLLIAGWDNLLAPKSVIRHHFEFSRSITKWYWMERNRGIVLLTLYRAWTLVLLTPAILAIEIATWLFALKGGWVKEKARADAWFFRGSSWRYLLKKRREVAKTRRATRGDREILKLFVSDIAHQEIENGFMTRVANPLMRAYFVVLKTIS
jgi:GT2 family glycosyltransferase